VAEVANTSAYFLVFIKQKLKGLMTQISEEIWVLAYPTNVKLGWK